MIYFLLLVILGDGIYIEAYADRAECEIRRQEIFIEHPDVDTTCLRMGDGENV